MTRTTCRDRGASVVGFVMLMIPTLLLLFAVLQVAVWFYARNVMASAAADAARYTASTVTTPTAGAQRAHEQVLDGLHDETAKEIECTDTFGYNDSGLPITTVRCLGKPKMLLLPYTFPVKIDVHSSVLREVAQ